MAQSAAQAPTTAQWTSLYNLYWTIAIIAGIITVGTLVFFALRYRSKPSAGPVGRAGQPGIRVVLVIVFVMALVLGSVAFALFQAIAFYGSILIDATTTHVNVIA